MIKTYQDLLNMLLSFNEQELKQCPQIYDGKEIHVVDSLATAQDLGLASDTMPQNEVFMLVNQGE